MKKNNSKKKNLRQNDVEKDDMKRDDMKKDVQYGLMKGNRTICNKMVYCNDILSKGLGLMLRTEQSVDDTAWIFSFKNPRKISLTMAFVFFSIDVIFLNEKKEVVEMTSLNSWESYFPKERANYCIELKRGTIAAVDLRLGDKLSFP